MKKIKFILYLMSWVLTMFIALRYGSSKVEWEWIYELRLPRVILGLGVGAALSVSGLILQTLFQNPLSDPYTLGVSSGAALGAVIGNVTGYGMTAASLFGSLLFSAILQLLAFLSRGRMVIVLLGGVMLGFLGSSMVWLWMALMNSNGLQSAIGWIMGSLARADWHNGPWILISVLVVCVVVWLRSQEFDGLLLGDDNARSIGIDVEKFRRNQIFMASVLVALSVSGAGMIGFVGLVVPHFLRSVLGTKHRVLIPACVIVGGQFVVLCDLISRVVARPSEIPVGIVTALIGAPIFLKMMLSQARKKEAV